MSTPTTNPIQIELPPSGAATIRFTDPTTGLRRTTWVAPEVLGRTLTQLPNDSGSGRGPWVDLLNTAGVAWRGTAGQALQVVMRRPGGLRHIHYHGAAYDVIIPAELGWDAVWEQEHLRNVHLWLCRPDALHSIALPGQVVPWPYGNVFNHGGICWGDNRVDTIRPGDVLEIEARFFGTPFNTDLRHEEFGEFEDYRGRTLPLSWRGAVPFVPQGR